MSTALATYELDREKIDLIKATVAKGSTDLELELFFHACKRTGLDPLMKQIYAIKRKNNKTGKEEMSIQTGIDGYRLIADRTGQYAGSDEAVYTVGDDGFPDVASVTVYKLVGSLRCAFSSSARWNEYYSDTSPMWKKMPFLMLGKCAEALALRKAFPAELSGVYTHEEMTQADQEPAGKTSYQKFDAISSQPVDTKQAFAERHPEQAKAIQQKMAQGNGMTPAGLTVADALDAPVSLMPEYLDQISLSQSVQECSKTLNAALKDPTLTLFDTTQLQEAGKKKIVELRQAKVPA